jgi:hypothetical protein
MQSGNEINNERQKGKITSEETQQQTNQKEK